MNQYRKNQQFSQLLTYVIQTSCYVELFIVFSSFINNSIVFGLKYSINYVYVYRGVYITSKVPHGIYVTYVNACLIWQDWQDTFNTSYAEYLVQRSATSACLTAVKVATYALCSYDMLIRHILNSWIASKGYTSTKMNGMNVSHGRH